MLPRSSSSLHDASLHFPQLPAVEKCLLAPPARYWEVLSALPGSLNGNEPQGAVLSVYDKDINNTVL